MTSYKPYLDKSKLKPIDRDCDLLLRVHAWEPAEPADDWCVRIDLSVSLNLSLLSLFLSASIFIPLSLSHSRIITIIISWYTACTSVAAAACCCWWYTVAHSQSKHNAPAPAIGAATGLYIILSQYAHGSDGFRDVKVSSAADPTRAGYDCMCIIPVDMCHRCNETHPSEPYNIVLYYIYIYQPVFIIIWATRTRAADDTQYYIISVCEMWNKKNR